MSSKILKKFGKYSYIYNKTSKIVLKLLRLVEMFVKWKFVLRKSFTVYINTIEKMYSLHTCNLVYITNYYKCKI